MIDLYQTCEAFVRWLDKRLLVGGRGDELFELDVDPDGRFWLGRLAPEDQVIALGLGDRGERLDPCACAIRVRPSGPGPWALTVDVRASCWIRSDTEKWRKTAPASASLAVTVPASSGQFDYGGAELRRALAGVAGDETRSAVIRVDVERAFSGEPELTISLINLTPLDDPPARPRRDLNLYETWFCVRGLPTTPFVLESLPDSFRYDRSVAAYGVNCGVRQSAFGFETTDTIEIEKARPTYWNAWLNEPDLRFATLSTDPLPQLHALVSALEAWGGDEWGAERLSTRRGAEGWTDEMLIDAQSGAHAFSAEVERIRKGIAYLESNAQVFLAFRLMNDAMIHSSNGKYDSWRAFQVGFLLANLASVVSDDSDAGVVDIVWFATGGGKTETYLGLLVTAALYDRQRGKSDGITAWSRFPLRMLSLQQTQRFADAMAGAELARRGAELGGAPFSVGFFVGQAGTPNRVSPEPKDGDPDPEDDDMPAHYQVLLRCPFCHNETLEMAFNRRFWRLEHRCRGDACPWPEVSLPFYIVDEEIYRYLPTVVVGTLDKAASIAIQAAMRGFIGPPHGICSEAEHGFVYAPRSKRPNGCLVPGCRGTVHPLSGDRSRFAPTFRLQDELHLLRDSLGAVDAHYESLLDHLQVELGGNAAKILASSATLAGFEKQVDVLYARTGRVFPVQGPTASSGFWTTDTDNLARRFVAVAARGVTLEFAVDRMLTALQAEVRRLATEPGVVCAEAGVDPSACDHLLSIYGVDVVYGNSLRDLDAATRSLDTQVPIRPLNVATLTGRTDFEEVRQTLERLERPEPGFEERIHVVSASSMMSHGVDIDRLNVMVVLGVPLTTAEFIQTTARVGRRWPGLVYVMHKIARERDAGVFRSFEHFILQGDRFIEPVPVTRRSRRVLQRTAAGLELARILHIYEARSQRALTTVRSLRQYFGDAEIGEDQELQALIHLLGLTGDLDAPMRGDLETWVEAFFGNLLDPAGEFRFPSDLCPWGGPMISLRDVEEQAPIRD